MNCENCTSLRVNGERFCKGCKKALLSEMKNKGYLTKAPTYFGGAYRSGDKCEDTNATKYGNDR